MTTQAVSKAEEIQTQQLLDEKEFIIRNELVFIDQVIEGMRSGVKAALHIGEIALQAKALLKHGAFQSWLQERFDMDASRINTYMRLYKSGMVVPEMSLNTMKLLLSNKTPQSVKERVLSGELPPSSSLIKRARGDEEEVEEEVNQGWTVPMATVSIMTALMQSQLWDMDEQEITEAFQQRLDSYQGDDDDFTDVLENVAKLGAALIHAVQAYLPEEDA